MTHIPDDLCALCGGFGLVPHREGCRLAAALSALEEARRDSETYRQGLIDWRFRAEAAESRADALQAEVDRLREANVQHAAAEASAWKQRAEAVAERDAAWRAGVEAMRETAVCVVSALRGGGSIEHGERSRVVEVLRCLALPPPSATAAPAEEEKGDDDEGPFCPAPCGGDLYLTASAGSAWLATCGSCGKVWSQQPWVTESSGRAPSRGEVG